MKVRTSRSLIPLLDNLPPDQWRQPTAFYASQLRECGRRLVLGLMGYPERKISKPQWQRAARFGDLIHEYVISICRGEEILEVSEKPLREIAPDPALLEEYKVSGRVDGILNRNGNRRLLEIKSMSADKFDVFAPGSEKFEDAYCQAQFYLFALKLEGGFILAVSRDDCAYKEYSITYDDPYVFSLLARIKRLKEHFDQQSLPEPERNRCHFCGYRGTDQCKSEGAEWL